MMNERKIRMSGRWAPAACLVFAFAMTSACGADVVNDNGRAGAPSGSAGQGDDSGGGGRGGGAQTAGTGGASNSSGGGRSSGSMSTGGGGGTTTSADATASTGGGRAEGGGAGGALVEAGATDSRVGRIDASSVVDGSGAIAAGDGGAVRSAGCGRARTLMDGRIDIQSGGMARFYILHTPANYDNTHPYRLVIGYHQRGGSAQAVSAVSNQPTTAFSTGNYYGLLPLSNNTTIFVAPQGQGTGANTGWPNTNDIDIDFTDEMLAQVEADLCVDTSRVFACGWSFGAAMSYEAACARPNVFRAVGAYSGSMLSGRCTPTTSTPVAYYATHGLGDTVLPIANGRALRDNYVRANGCTAQMPPEPTAGSGMHTCTTYTGCSSGHPVRWCAFDGPHEPGPTDRGQPSSWNPQETWQFFTQF